MDHVPCHKLLHASLVWGEVAMQSLPLDLQYKVIFNYICALTQQIEEVYCSIYCAHVSFALFAIFMKLINVQFF